MNLFVYDGTLDGLYSALFDAYTGKVFPDALLKNGDIPPLADYIAHKVETTTEKSERVLNGLKRRLSKEGLNDVLLAWLSEAEGHDTLLCRYLRKVFDSPRLFERNYADPDALRVRDLAKKTACESHKLLGFARFQKTRENLYFSAIAPRHNVLPLLLPHFADRFSGHPWVLYDARRNYGFLHNCDGFREIFLDPALIQNGRLSKRLLAEDELVFQALWKGYCQAIAIKERANPKLQANWMPRRYWKYLTEQQ